MLRPPSPTRCLILLGFISCIILFSLTSRYDLLDAHPGVQRQLLNPRQNSAPAGSASSPAASPPASPAASSSPSQADPTPSPPVTPTSAPSDSGTPPPAQSSNPPPASTPSDSPTPTPTPSDPTSLPPPAASSDPPSVTPPATPLTSASISVGADGETQTVIYTITKGGAASSASVSASAVPDDGSASSKSGKSTIVGLSVAGGIALVGIGVFLWWKFGRKRGGGGFDDNEAIQWPELNTHGDDTSKFANRSTAFETNSEVNLTRPDSRAGSLAPSAATSTADLYSNQDPYAVPPLPHLNPNQPYRDDPNQNYYDPYGAPPPPQGYSDSPDVGMGGESIPMTQINNNRSRSPGPQAAYDMGGPGAGGRRSPGPQAAYDMGMGGRQSPGPQVAYGGGRVSPGPGVALGGRASPGPQAAYGYGNGRQSPGPQGAYGI